MSIRKTIITTVVALTMVAIVAPGVAQGLTIEDLMAQIAQLQAQLVTLQGQAQSGTTTGVLPANCVGITFNRNLTRSMTGSDVKCLQTLLNQLNVNVANIGAGSPGNETSFFGGATRAAVIRFQELYRSEILTPVGLTTGTGFVGASTRAKLNLLLSGWTTTTPPVTPTAGCPAGATYNSITGALCPVTPTTPVVPTGAGLTVALAADTPATGVVVNGQGLAPLAKITFYNGDNAEVKVTGLKLKRIGISADASLDNIYLFDGAVRLTDGAAVSSTMINFNLSSGIFTVPAGGMKTITVVADIGGTAGEIVGVQIVASSDVTTNASSIKGTFPITGNTMSLATGTLASVVFNTTTTPAASSIDPQNDYTVFQNSVVVYTRAVDLTRISLRKTGSVTNTDLQNFRLYIDGVQVGSAVQNLDANGYLTFDMTSSPKRLEAGTRVVKVLADIIGGSSLKFTFNLWNSADATFVDSQYGANILIESVADGTAFTKRDTGEQTVNSGVLTITKMTDSPSGNIVNGATNATLAKYQIKAAGEKVKIETLKVSVVVNTSGVSYLRNGMILANGIQIGSTADLYDNGYSTGYTSFSLGSSLIVDPLTPVTLEVKADIYDNDGSNGIVTTGTASTIQVTVEGSGSENNATGMVSAATIDAPSSDVLGNTLTVAAGGLTLSLDTGYSAHTAVAPLTAYKIADFNLTANTTEAVNITAINVTLDEISSYESNLYVRYGTKTTSVKPSLSTALNSWSINETLAAGASLAIEVYADVNSTPTSGTATAQVDVDGTTVSSATSADSTQITGQVITFSSGAFTTAFANTPQSQVVSGSQSNVEVARFKFTSSYQAYTIQELKFDPDVDANAGSDNAENIINSATLKDGSTVIATANWNGVDESGSTLTGAFFFTGLNISVPASTTKTLTLVMDFAQPSATNDTSGLRIIPALTYVKYMDPQGAVLTIADTAGTTYIGNATYVYKAIPTITKVALSGTTLTNNASQDLFSMKVAAPTQGDVAMKQFKVDLGWSDGGGNSDTLELESLLLYKDGVNITSSVNIVESAFGADITGTSGITETADSKIVVTWKTNTEDTITAGTSTTYTIRATPQGFNKTATVSTAAHTDSVSLAFNADTADVTFGTGDDADKDWIGFINIDTTYTNIMKLYFEAAANATAEEAQMIWSDMSAVAHSASTTAGTGDWTNAYLLGSLTPQTWTD